MKLKFRADSKDWAIFAAFCVALLYLAAIAVLNLSEFSKYGTFFGFNPLPAFSKEYILPTLVIFAAILAAIIMSVSSYFFDRVKGIGVSADAKQDKGYSRWATDKEMKKELKMVESISEKSDVAGIPIINDGKRIWVDAGEYHNLIIGSTGSGKTEMLIQPMVKLLAKKGESMIITDPKGEIYEKNALELREKGYNIVLLNFRNPQNGNCWNPFSLPYNLYKQDNQDKAIELLEDLALNILYDENAKSQDPFWEKTSADYFTGLALGLFEDAKPEEINLNSINLMTTAGEDKVAGNQTYMKEYFSYKSQASSAYINVASTLMAPNETKSSILSVFKQKIKLFSSRENLSEMLSHSDFDMEDIGRKKTAVFIVIQDEKKTYHSLVTIFLKQCYETLIRVAQENGGKLPFKTNFMLDEFANMPPLKDVTTMVTAARSRAIRFTFVIQNFAQLYEVYGKENGETIKGNCGNILYLISSELSALEEISKLCGDVKSKDKDKTDSKPLVTVSDLQRLPQWSMIALRIRMMPFKTKMTPNWQMVRDNNWGKNYGLATYPVRDKGCVQTFDIKEYVSKKKEEKISSMFGPQSSNKQDSNMVNPFFAEAARPANGPTPSNKPMGLDLDEMVKRIDAQIAKLEAEEKAEQEKAKLDSKVNIPDKKDEKIEAKPESIKNEPKMEPVKVEPKVESVPEPVKVEPTITEEKVTKQEEKKSNNFFDFIVPVKEENVEKEVKEESMIKPVKESKTKVEEKIEDKSSPDDLIVNSKSLEPVLESINIPTSIDVPSKVDVPSKPVKPVVEEPKVVKEESIINNPKVENVVISNNTNYITDDQFFDDFFADDE
ncbi:MAG TPA: type IV secretory system conjugative DNA transfer family protein [Bacilli bacterium]|nr:type IV secretory system conjugative DNA transfer family protein [Bacilli bacterium]